MAHMLPNTGVAFPAGLPCVLQEIVSEVLIISSLNFIILMRIQYTTSDSTIALLENTIIRIKLI